MTSSTFLLHPPFALPSAPADRGGHDASAGRDHADDAAMTPGWSPVPFVPRDVRLAGAPASTSEPGGTTAPAHAPVAAHPHAADEAVLAGDALAPGLHPTPVGSAAIDGAIGATASRDAGVQGQGELPSISDFLLAGALPEAGEDAPRWPIAEVGGEVARLSEALPTARGAAAPPARDELATAAGAEAHAPWSDDDAWLDIMPAASPAVTRELEAQTAWARAFAEPPAPLTPAPVGPVAPPASGVSGDAGVAAHALEEVARRLRAGELVLPAWSATGGEAAALAATLTALLGARR